MPTTHNHSKALSTQHTLSPLQGCMALAGLGLFRSLGHLFSLDYRVARRLLASSFEIAFCLVRSPTIYACWTHRHIHTYIRSV